MTWTNGRRGAAGALLAAGVALVGLGWVIRSQRVAEPSSSSLTSPASHPAPSGNSASASASASAAAPIPPLLDTHVWKVPVEADDPVKGAKDALVTIVAFSEFQSSFCQRASATLDELLAANPKTLRVVWKDNPLPFNERAKPAAALARFAFERGGSPAFWRAHDQLFAHQQKLSDSELQVVATAVGLPWAEAKAAIDGGRFTEKIDQSIELGGDVKARGTPHFFINGRRLAGAQSRATFQRLIDDELKHAQGLVARGIPAARVYDETIKAGEGPPPLVHKDIPEPDAHSPFRGEARARLAVQQFARFPCADCERTTETLAFLEQEYRGRLKTVFRFVLPADDTRTLLVAEAAQEVFEQAGSAAFWTYQDRVLDTEQRTGALPDQATLEKIATETGVNAPRLRQALRTGKHRKRVQVDAELARKADIAKTPAFVVGGYYLEDAPPSAVFKKAIRRALRERRE